MDSGGETVELNGQAEGAEPAAEREPRYDLPGLTCKTVELWVLQSQRILSSCNDYGKSRFKEVRHRPSQWFQRNRPMNINHYANKKSAAESMLDVALLMANASQLKAVMEQGPSFSFYIPLIVLISLSLTLQVMVGILLIFLVKYDLNNPAKHDKLDFLNNLTTGLVFIIVVVNIFITAFGVQKPMVESVSKQ